MITQYNALGGRQQCFCRSKSLGALAKRAPYTHATQFWSKTSNLFAALLQVLLRRVRWASQHRCAFSSLLKSATFSSASLFEAFVMACYGNYALHYHRRYGGHSGFPSCYSGIKENAEATVRRDGQQSSVPSSVREDTVGIRMAGPDGYAIPSLSFADGNGSKWASKGKLGVLSRLAPSQAPQSGKS